MHYIIPPFGVFSFQIAALQEDKKALERHTKSKESALLEAERILRSALERALIVEEVQNQNYELRRQIEICQACYYTRSCYIVHRFNHEWSI